MKESQLRQALRSRPSHSISFQVEMAGEPAFDWILREVRSKKLSDREMVHGLSLLWRLTRQHCQPRKGDLLDLVASLSEDPDVSEKVRSRAMHLAIGHASVSRLLTRRDEFFGRPLSQIDAEVENAVRRALVLGVTPDMRSVGEKFLASLPLPDFEPNAEEPE